MQDNSGLRGHRDIVCYYDVIDENFGIKNKFSNYLKEIHRVGSDKHFSFKYFVCYPFLNTNITKSVGTTVQFICFATRKETDQPF